MDNEALKQVFRNLNAKIIREVDPEFVIDELFGKDVITHGDYDELSNVPDPKVRCRKLFVLLHGSSHPDTFIQLREALLDEYPKIVDEIDKQLTLLPTRHTQKPRMSQATEGKLMSVSRPLLSRYENMLDHISMPIFSFDTKLFHFFPRQANFV